MAAAAAAAIAAALIVLRMRNGDVGGVKFLNRAFAGSRGLCDIGFRRIRLALSDVMMPGMSGMRTMSGMRRSRRWRERDQRQYSEGRKGAKEAGQAEHAALLHDRRPGGKHFVTARRLYQ